MDKNQYDTSIYIMVNTSKLNIVLVKYVLEVTI